MSRARGTNIHHMRAFIQQRFGADAWTRVLGAMTPSDAAELRSLVPVGWYELGLQYRLLRATGAVLGEGEGSFVEAIGQFEAQQDLTVVHRLFLRMANPGFVLQQSGRYWSRFYSSGTWEITRHSSTHAGGVLRELNPFDPLMAQYLHAYIREMWSLMGVEGVRTRSWIEGETIYFDGDWG